jgi:hypothetical protein
MVTNLFSQLHAMQIGQIKVNDHHTKEGTLEELQGFPSQLAANDLEALRRHNSSQGPQLSRVIFHKQNL